MNSRSVSLKWAHYWLRAKCFFGFHYWVYDGRERRCCLRGFCTKRQVLWRDPVTRAWTWTK